MNGNGAGTTELDIAQHLIAFEARNSNRAAGPGALQVCEKLRRPLSRLAGVAGYRALLMRALFLARRESDALAAVRITEDGSLEGLTCSATEPEGTLLVAELLGLLVTFRGEDNMLRILNEIWPDVVGPEMMSAHWISRHEMSRDEDQQTVSV
jgi:hypothetical protein